MPTGIEGRVFRRICVALDGGEPAQAALELSLELARSSGAAVTLAHVARAPEPDDEPIGERHAIAFELLGLCPCERWRGRLAAIAAAASPHVRAEGVVTTGTPVTELLRLVDRTRPDLVVTGTRGVSGPRRVLRTVSQALLDHAPCPVLLVRGRPATPPAPIVLACVEGPQPSPATLLVAGRLAGVLSARLLRSEPDPAALLAAAQGQRPLLGVVSRPRRLVARRDRTLIDRAPCPMLVVRPSLVGGGVAERWRLAPMARAAAGAHDPGMTAPRPKLGRACVRAAAPVAARLRPAPS